MTEEEDLPLDEMLVVSGGPVTQTNICSGLVQRGHTCFQQKRVAFWLLFRSN